MDHFSDQLDAMGALAEPVRRTLYHHVTRQPEPVSRENAAVAAGVPLHTAKFHLDRLVDAGLLEVEYRRLSGRTGPGAGRPSKLYKRSAQELSVSLPERRYDIAGEVLATTVERAVEGGSTVAELLPQVARDVGRRIGAGHVGVDSGAPGADWSEPIVAAAAILGAHGYEPQIGDVELRLTNCPFDKLAAEHTQLVCGMNRDLVEGVLDGARLEGLRARLAPHTGFCCVRVDRTGQRDDASTAG